MRILVLTDRFTPEIAAPSFRIMDHAQAWLKMGHEVTVVTCVPNFPRGEVFPGYRNRFYQEEWLSGVRIIRLWSYMAENVGTFRRTIDYVSFMSSAIVQSPRYPKFDVILASSPPLFVAMAGLLVSKIRRRPWVFEVRDLWPASIRAVGAGGGASHGRMMNLLEQLELFLYRKADRIVCVTNTIREDLMRRGIQPEKIDVVTNGVDTLMFNRANVAFDARERLGIAQDAFLCAYIGTVGMSHGLRTILDAAEQCRRSPHIQFLIMGEGAERAALEAEAKTRQLSRVLFRDFVKHGEVPAYIAASDVSIVHLKPDPVFAGALPSKMFECMAMGAAMLFAVEGESARIVAEAGAGMCIRSGDAAAMADAIEKLDRDRAMLRKMGERGRQVAEHQYSRRIKALEAIASLEKAISTARGATTGNPLADPAAVGQGEAVR